MSRYWPTATRSRAQRSVRANAIPEPSTRVVPARERFLATWFLRQRRLSLSRVSCSENASCAQRARASPRVGSWRSKRICPAATPPNHAYRGQTRRNRRDVRPPGARLCLLDSTARFCFNVVTEPVGVPSAVLIRAVEPLKGVELMAKRRAGKPRRDLARGPARLCEAFAIDRAFDGWDLTRGEQLWIAEDPTAQAIDARTIATAPRVGVTVPAQPTSLALLSRQQRVRQQEAEALNKAALAASSQRLPRNRNPLHGIANLSHIVAVAGHPVESGHAPGERPAGRTRSGRQSASGRCP